MKWRKLNTPKYPHFLLRKNKRLRVSHVRVLVIQSFGVHNDSTQKPLKRQTPDIVFNGFKESGIAGFLGYKTRQDCLNRSRIFAGVTLCAEDTSSCIFYI